MSINVEKLNRLNKLVSMFFRNKHTIVLNPEEKISNEQDLEEVERICAESRLSIHLVDGSRISLQFIIDDEGDI